MGEISILTYHITQANFLPVVEAPSLIESGHSSSDSVASLQNIMANVREDNELHMQRKVSYDDQKKAQM